jgi:hypothetical protein
LATLACGGEASAPNRHGDTLIVDVEASTTVPQAADGAIPEGDDAPYAIDAPTYPEDTYGTSYESQGADGASALCASQCTCGPGSFCFGGGSGAPAFSGTCDHGLGTEVGCDPTPAGCTTCECVLSSLFGQRACHCVAGTWMTVLCP